MKNIFKDFPALDAGNYISLAALAISLASIIWQIINAWFGAELTLLSPAGRPMQIECSSTKRATCWGIEGGTEPEGRLAVVLPVFLYNTGAAGYNALVESVSATVTTDGPTNRSVLVANQFFELVQGSENKSRPFVPFLVEGSKANGAELRFISFYEQHFTNWANFSSQIINGEVNRIEISIEVHVVGENEPLIEKCTMHLSDRLRATLQNRKERRARAYLASVCK